jgi:hypothetical protein
MVLKMNDINKKRTVTKEVADIEIYDSDRML